MEHSPSTILQTEAAYRRAVSKLQQLLSEAESSDLSMGISPYPKLDLSESKSVAEDTDTSSISSPDFPRSSARRNLFVSSTPWKVHTKEDAAQQSLAEEQHQLIQYIRKQSSYITALEKETKFHRKNLASIVEEVKKLVSENETLRSEQHFTVIQQLVNAVESLNRRPEYTPILAPKERDKPEENPAWHEVQETRQMLAATKEELYQLQEKFAALQSSGSKEEHKQFVEQLLREREELASTVQKLRHNIANLQERESDALQQVRQGVEVAEQAQLERAQMESEVRQLANVLERQEQQTATLIAEQERRWHEEKQRLEAKFGEQLAAITHEKELQMENYNRAAAECEHLRRNEVALKHELGMKAGLVESVREEMQRQISHSQAEISRLLGQKTELERKLGEHELKQEVLARETRKELLTAQTQITVLQKHTQVVEQESKNHQDMCLKFKEALASKERELAVLKLRSNQGHPLPSEIETWMNLKDSNLTKNLLDSEAKTSSYIKQLEEIVEKQQKVLEKLRANCRKLLNSLKENQVRYRQEVSNWSKKLEQAESRNAKLEKHCSAMEVQGQKIAQHLCQVVLDKEALLLSSMPAQLKGI